jgi:predicted Fe-S protein YdhL (DUF1289 family)
MMEDFYCMGVGRWETDIGTWLKYCEQAKNFFADKSASFKTTVCNESD